MTDRRSFLTAALIAPVAIVAPAMAAPRSTWDRLLADYRSTTAAMNAHPYGNTLPCDPRYKAISADHERYLQKACRALDAVMEHPVTDNAMLAEKMEIAVNEFGGDNFMDRILKDAKRLAA